MTGVLLAHGHDLSVLERWSWQEISVAVRAILAYKGWTLDKLIQIVGPAFGVKPKAGGKGKAPSAQASETEVDSFFSRFG